MVSALITTHTAHMGADTIVMGAMEAVIIRPTTAMAPTGRARTVMATNIARHTDMVEAMEEEAMVVAMEDMGMGLATEAMAATTHRPTDMEATRRTARSEGKDERQVVSLLLRFLSLYDPLCMEMNFVDIVACMSSEAVHVDQSHFMAIGVLAERLKSVGVK